MTQQKKHIFALLYIFLLIAFTGCTAKINIRANSDKSANLDFSMDLGTKLSETIRAVGSSLMQMNGETINTDTNVPIFSAQLIESAFNNTDFENVTITTPTESSLNMSGRIPAPENQQATLKASDAKVANFVTCTQSSLTIILAPETVQAVISSMPENLIAYTDLLMAPVFTGEPMSIPDYRDLIATIYGDEIASEMDKATVQIALLPPEGKNIKKSSLSDTERARTSSSKAVFTIPLIEFFTLSSPKTFSITF